MELELSVERIGNWRSARSGNSARRPAWHRTSRGSRAARSRPGATQTCSGTNASIAPLSDGARSVIPVILRILAACPPVGGRTTNSCPWRSKRSPIRDQGQGVGVKEVATPEIEGDAGQSGADGLLEHSLDQRAGGRVELASHRDLPTLRPADVLLHVDPGFGRVSIDRRVESTDGRAVRQHLEPPATAARQRGQCTGGCGELIRSRQLGHSFRVILIFHSSDADLRSSSSIVRLSHRLRSDRASGRPSSSRRRGRRSARRPPGAWSSGSSWLTMNDGLALPAAIRSRSCRLYFFTGPGRCRCAGP